MGLTMGEDKGTTIKISGIAGDQQAALFGQVDELKKEKQRIRMVQGAHANEYWREIYKVKEWVIDNNCNWIKWAG